MLQILNNLVTLFQQKTVDLDTAVAAILDNQWQMNTSLATNYSTPLGYDRRTTQRRNLKKVSLRCWHRGKELSIHVIEATRNGARVILPSELCSREELILVCTSPQGESYGEYRVVWKEKIAGQKVIAGLHCLLSHDCLAA